MEGLLVLLTHPPLLAMALGHCCFSLTTQDSLLPPAMKEPSAEHVTGKSMGTPVAFMHDPTTLNLSGSPAAPGRSVQFRQGQLVCSLFELGCVQAEVLGRGLWLGRRWLRL